MTLHDWLIGIASEQVDHTCGIVSMLVCSGGLVAPPG